MMIINSTKRFFWTAVQKNLSIVNKTSVLIALCLSLLFACTQKEKFQLKSLKNDSGWGYTISEGEKIIIKQSIIPVIGNNKSFKTEEDALKVGALVLKKINENKPPTITKKDLNLLSIKT